MFNYVSCTTVHIDDDADADTENVDDDHDSGTATAQLPVPLHRHVRRPLAMLTRTCAVIKGNNNHLSHACESAARVHSGRRIRWSFACRVSQLFLITIGIHRNITFDIDN